MEEVKAPETTEAPVVEAAPAPPAPEPKAEPVTESSIEDKVLAEMAQERSVEAKKPVGPPPPAKEVKPPSRLDGMDDGKRAEYFKAYRNLRWTGLNEEAINLLPVDKVIEAGKNAGERRSERDREYAKQRNQTDSRQDSANPTPHERPGKQGQPRRPAPEPEYDDRTSDDESDPVDDLLNDDIQDVGQRPRRNAEAERFRQEAHDAREKLSAALIQSAIRSAEGDFPQIKDQTQLAKIAARMEYLDPDLSVLRSGEGSEVNELFRQACLIEYGDQLLHKSRAAARETAEAIRGGQPSPTGGKGAPAKPMSEDELEDAVLRALSTSGGSTTAASKALDRMMGL